jgi:hypothetical protein
MINEMTAEQIRALLKVEPHATCGFVHVTFMICALSNKVGRLGDARSAWQMYGRARLQSAPNRADGPAVRPYQTHLNAVQVTT